MANVPRDRRFRGSRRAPCALAALLVVGGTVGIAGCGGSQSPQPKIAEREAMRAESSETEAADEDGEMTQLPDGAWTVVFADGSGNTYKFSGRGSADLTANYAPVKPQMSSSGTYDGGEPFTGELAAEDARKIWEAVVRLADAPDEHIEHRVMGSGQFSVKSEQRSATFIIPNGEQLQQFQAFAESLRTR